MTQEEIKQEIVRKVAERDAGKTICPSEVARAISSDESEWRALMPEVREAAIELQKLGEIRITQKGEAVLPPFSGPIRLSKTV